MSCIPACIPDFSRLGASMGQIFFVGSFFGLLSGPIAGWILATSPSGNWLAVEGFVGGSLLVSAVTLAAIRHYINPNWRKIF